MKVVARKISKWLTEREQLTLFILGDVNFLPETVVVKFVDNAAVTFTIYAHMLS